MQGKTIIGYTLQRLLGKGGMAEVWYAENAIGKKAAVKLLLPKFCNDEAIVARFQNEAKVMVQLDHPNIRQVYDYGNIDGRPCIVMEYLEGDDLKALMKSGKHFTDSDLRSWWNQIADALNYTHSEGVVHRDIKPSNIFIDKKGHVKLLDFGIAKIKESISMTQTGTMMGTLIYMSPEQVMDSKHIGPESDIYSLAVTFVHLLTGKAPYDSTTSNDYTIRKGIVEIPLDLTQVPPDWKGFLMPYLNKDYKHRPKLRSFEPVTMLSPNVMVEESQENADEATVIQVVPQPEMVINVGNTRGYVGVSQTDPKETTTKAKAKGLFTIDDKPNWKQLGIFWLASYVLFALVLGIAWEFEDFDYDLGTYLQIHIQLTVFLGLGYLLVNYLNKKIENFILIFTAVILAIFLFCLIDFDLDFICNEYSLIAYFMVIITLIALSALFVYIPDKFKVLPFVAVVLAVFWIMCCSDFLDDFDFDEGLLHDLVYEMDDLDLEGIEYAILAAIPITPLVVFAVKRFKMINNGKQ